MHEGQLWCRVNKGYTIRLRTGKYQLTRIANWSGGTGEDHLMCIRGATEAVFELILSQIPLISHPYFSLLPSPSLLWSEPLPLQPPFFFRPPCLAPHTTAQPDPDKCSSWTFILPRTLTLFPNNHHQNHCSVWFSNWTSTGKFKPSNPQPIKLHIPPEPQRTLTLFTNHNPIPDEP